ncbi:hypothetical protein QTP88_005131 [Uroleucon formosanum]
MSSSQCYAPYLKRESPQYNELMLKYRKFIVFIPVLIIYNIPIQYFQCFNIYLFLFFVFWSYSFGPPPGIHSNHFIPHHPSLSPLLSLQTLLWILISAQAPNNNLNFTCIVSAKTCCNKFAKNRGDQIVTSDCIFCSAVIFHICQKKNDYITFKCDL